MEGLFRQVARPLLLSVLCLSATGCAAALHTESPAASPRAPHGPTADGPADPSTSAFERPWIWTDERGTPIRLSQWRGTLLVVTVVYTDCNTTCPLTIDKLRRIHQTFETEGRAAEFVLVTLDPATDTAERLRSFKAERGLPASWHLLRGSERQTQELADFLHIKTMNESAHIFHDARIVFLDARGRILGQYRG